MADEMDWLEMLVASERVEKWLSIVCRSENSLASRRGAMQQLADATMEREAYAEEARQAGAVSCLTKVLANTGDEALLDAAADVIAACSGLLACGGQDLVLKQALVKFCTQMELASAFRHKSQVIKYGELTIHIKEGALGDGLGARVWVVAHTLCRELLKHPAIVGDKKVLEIGSGCGLCGILAAKLGAAQVVLTDHEDKVLHNLRDCVAANSHASPGGCTAALPAASEAANTAQTAAEMHDPEDAEACDDLDDFFAGNPAQESASQIPRDTTSWDIGNMLVRHLDWEESLSAEQAQQSNNTTGTHEKDVGNQPGAAIQAGPDATLAPHVAIEDKFEVVIGTDILYEEAHSKLVAAVLSHRLTIHGQALLCCAVRDQAIFEQFARELEARNMQAKVVTVEPKADDRGIVGQQHDYEGGFVLMAVRRNVSATQWHGDVL